jgi:hypothetical protein
MAAILSICTCKGRMTFSECPTGTPITDRIIDASIQWAEQIMQRIDTFHPE